MRRKLAIPGHVFIFLIALIAFSAASPALAHRLNVFVLPEGDRVTGEAYFNDGAPVQNSPIQLLDADDKVLHEGLTDGDGAFSLPVPEGVTDLTVVVEGGMGHRGETHVTLSPRKESAPVATIPRPTSTVTGPTAAPVLSADDIEALVRKVVSREVAPLKEEILRLNQKLSRPGMTEIFGGLGYIVGLVGVTLWAGSRKKDG